jgi:hypothetical protein
VGLVDCRKQLRVHGVNNLVVVRGNLVLVVLGLLGLSILIQAVLVPSRWLSKLLTSL